MSLAAEPWSSTSKPGNAPQAMTISTLQQIYARTCAEHIPIKITLSINVITATTHALTAHQVTIV